MRFSRTMLFLGPLWATLEPVAQDGLKFWYDATDEAKNLQYSTSVDA